MSVVLCCVVLFVLVFVFSNMASSLFQKLSA